MCHYGDEAQRLITHIKFSYILLMIKREFTLPRSNYYLLDQLISLGKVIKLKKLNSPTFLRYAL